MTTVVIADDQDLVRGGLRIILEQQDDITVCGEAATGAQAITAVREHRPDVVLMDVRMPELDGLEAMRVIARENAAVKVLILTTYDLDEYVVAALREGASGYLLKDAAPFELARAVQAVAAGETVLAPSVVGRVVDSYVHAAPARGIPPSLAKLSARERDVLRALARGGTNAEIAAELFVSPATVKTHVASILAKLGLRDRVQAVILAYESGFVPRG